MANTGRRTGSSGKYNRDVSQKDLVSDCFFRLVAKVRFEEFLEKHKEEEGRLEAALCPVSSSFYRAVYSSAIVNRLIFLRHDNVALLNLD